MVKVEHTEVGLVYCAGRLNTSHWALWFSSPSSELLVTFHPSLSCFATSLMLLFLSPEHNTIKVYSEPLLSNTHGCLQYGALSWTLLLFMTEGFPLHRSYLENIGWGVWTGTWGGICQSLLTATNADSEGTNHVTRFPYVIFNMSKVSNWRCCLLWALAYRKWNLQP